MADEQDATLYANRVASALTGSEYVLAAESDALNAAGLNIPISAFVLNGKNGNYVIGTRTAPYLFNVGIGGDGVIGIISGATKAARFNPDANQMSIEGVSTDGTTFQPLAIGGQFVKITQSGSEVGRFISGALLLNRTNSSLGGGAGYQLQVGSGGVSAGVTIHSNNIGSGDIQFSDGPTGADSYRGLIRYAHSSDEFQIWTNATTQWVIQAAGHILPVTNGTKNLGAASNRLGTVYAATGAINTSDETQKKWLQTGLVAEKKNRISSKINDDAFYLAGLEIRKEFGFYQWIEAIKDKGEGARIHYGIRAQRVFSILEKHGIDPARVAFCCYDEWDDVHEPIYKTITRKEKREALNPSFNPKKKPSSKNKKTIQVAVETKEQVNTGKTKIRTKAGKSYGLRLDMLNAFMGSVRDRRQDDLDNRLALLEKNKP